MGLETTLKRPIINTRDEPHADPALWRRLHVIVGDANLSETATLLKLGTTAIVLAMIEAGGPDLGITPGQPGRGDAPGVPRPDPGRARWSCIGRAADDRAADPAGVPGRRRAPAARPTWADPIRDQGDPRPLGRGAGRPREPSPAPWPTGSTGWPSWRSWRGTAAGTAWTGRRTGSPRSTCSTPTPDPSAAWPMRLEQRGSLRRITTDEEVARAVVEPPTDTRAWFRGECVRRFGDAGGGRLLGLGHLRRARHARRWCGCRRTDPLRGTRAHVADAAGSRGQRRRAGRRPARDLTGRPRRAPGRASSRLAVGNPGVGDVRTVDRH